MAIKETVINLSAEEALRVMRILIDEDCEQAMLFLKECLKPRLENATRDH